MAKRLLTDPSPALRKSLEELLVKEGSFRWNRLENLLREGSKSSDFDSDQLWLLAEWVFGEGSNSVRKPLTKETVKILDAVIADAWRQQAAVVYGKEVAERMLPHQPGESKDRERAQLLVSAAAVRLSGDPSGAPPPLRSPQETLRALQEALDAAGRTVPRVGKLMQSRGAAEFTAEVWSGLATRGMARFVRLAANGGDPRSREQFLRGLGSSFGPGEGDEKMRQVLSSR